VVARVVWLRGAGRGLVRWHRKKAAVAQRLGLVGGKPEVGNGFVAQNLAKEIEVGRLVAGVLCGEF
jgi:hypothetical protein